MANTIILKGDGIRKERPAAAAGIRPGDLLEIDSTGDYAVHSGAGLTVGAKTFAFENELAGKAIDDNYLVDEQVLAVACKSGMEILAWLLDGEVAVIGSVLDSAGDGNLKVVDVSVATGQDERNAIVAVALEALSPSGSDGRIKVEIV